MTSSIVTYGAKNGVVSHIINEGATYAVKMTISEYKKPSTCPNSQDITKIVQKYFKAPKGKVFFSILEGTRVKEMYFTCIKNCSKY